MFRRLFEWRSASTGPDVYYSLRHFGIPKPFIPFGEFEILHKQFLIIKFAPPHTWLKFSSFNSSLIPEFLFKSCFKWAWIRSTRMQIRPWKIPELGAAAAAASPTLSRNPWRTSSTGTTSKATQVFRTRTMKTRHCHICRYRLILLCINIRTYGHTDIRIFGECFSRAIYARGRNWWVDFVNRK